jgi:hypothetical protein
MVCALRVISNGNLRSVSLTLADIVGIFEKRYDPAWAESWDAVGLVCGDPEAGSSPWTPSPRSPTRRSNGAPT